MAILLRSVCFFFGGGDLLKYLTGGQFSPRAPLYAEVLYDWVKTMNVISGGNRLMRWVNPFSWDRRSSMEKQLAEEMAALQDEVCVCFASCALSLSVLVFSILFPLLDLKVAHKYYST